ncbi:hypothetical protein [Halobacillus sp. H74]|uniref:hypothetical protein n=1 Tax=Halobacillus sp. H74 TaxID=3457436 RepID=UPI003FCEC6B4
MKNLLKAFIILSFSLTIAACNGGKASPLDSRHIALEWAEAELQWDGEQRMKLLTSEAKEKYRDSTHVKGEALNPDLTIENYEMTEWKINDSTYIYKIRYPDQKEIDTTWTKILKTDEGWRVSDIAYYYYEAKPLIKNIKPTTIKEMER